MDIVYVSNDKYVEHAAAAIHSVYAKNRDTVVNVFLVSVGISAGNRTQLGKIAQNYGQKLHVINFENILDKLGTGARGERFDFSTFGRFFLGSLLPDAIERVIYLDADTIVNDSLRGIWDTYLGNNIIAAAQEPTIYKETRKAVGLNEKEPYFNAGVMLIDLNRWRGENVEGQLLAYYQENVGKLKFCDQDAINAVLKGRIATLNPRFNFFSNYYYFKYQTLIKNDPSYKVISEMTFNAAKANPAVIHFAGAERPWFAGCRNHYTLFYEEALKETAWENAPKETGSETYLFWYHLMNVSTGIFPPLRRFISRTYGERLYQ